MGDKQGMDDTGRMPPSAEQRRWPRYPVFIDALMTGEGVESRACKIRDFCASGLFLSFERETEAGIASRRPPGIGTTIKVHFTLSVAGTDRPFLLSARVVRVMTAGLGVELIEPDPVIIAAMTQASQTLAVPTAARTPLPEVGKAPDAAKVERMAVLREVRRNLERAYNTWMENFFSHLEPTLLSYSRELGDAAVQREIFLHGQLLRDKRGGMTNDLRKVLLDQYDEACTRGVMPEEKRGGSGPGLNDGLSLVETDEFEQFLAVSEAVDRAETELGRSLFELNQRLSFLFGTRIDKGNNPFGPVFLARRVGEYLRRTRPGAEVLRACMHAYHDLAIPEIKRFYEETNAYLANSGVPLLGESVRPRIQPSPVRRRPPGADAGAAGADAGGGGYYSAPGGGAGNYYNPPAGGHGAAAGGAGYAGGAGPAGGGGGGAAAPGGSPNIAAQVQQLAASLPAGTPLMVAPVSAFQAAHTLFGLGRELKHTTIGPGTLDGMAAANAMQGSYNLAEINSALRMMEMTVGHDTTGLSPQLMRNALERALHSQDPQQAAPKQIRDTDWDLLELVLELFNAIVKDPRVIPEVKPYLRKLRRPVNMVAMADKSFFEQENHPARRLINDLARIRSTTVGEDKRSILPELDFIVDRIASEGAERPEVFAEADERLASLLQAQESEVGANLQELARAAEAQQQFMKARRKDTPGEARAQSVTTGEDWITWVNRVRRMKVGDEMLLGSGAAQRMLKLAWVADDGGAYVFADPVGRKAGSFGVQELAMQLRRGSAQLVEDLPLPTMDRAIVKSLENLHGRLEQQVNADKLTSLLTDKAFLEELEKALAQARQERESHVAAMIGIDEPAAVQQLSEEEREARVKMHAERVRAALPEGTAAARFGDQMFGVLLTDTTQGNGYQALEKVVQAVQAVDPSGVAGGRARVGLVPFSTEPMDAEQVVSAMHTALRLAQSPGSAVIRIVHVEEETGEEARISSRLSEQLRQALDGKKVKLAFQRIAPQLDKAATPLPTHFELMPVMYLQGGTRIAAQAMRVAAEQIQRSTDLDRWLISSAMRWIVEHPDKLPVNGMCVLSLSMASIKDASLAGFIGEEFINTAAPPSRICFEIREDAGAAGSPEATDLVNALREYGCRFMYGDFGSEPASFTRAAALKVSLVRLGRMQNRDMVADRGDAALVKSAIEMAHFFSVPAVADSVDGKPALLKLRELGLDYAQGTAISPIEVII